VGSRPHPISGTHQCHQGKGKGEGKGELGCNDRAHALRQASRAGLCERVVDVDVRFRPCRQVGTGEQAVIGEVRIVDQVLVEDEGRILR